MSNLMWDGEHILKFEVVVVQLFAHTKTHRLHVSRG